MTTTIHLIRHAEATPRSIGNPDEYRHLTCRGRSRFRRVAALLKKTGIDPFIIFTSPATRAVQTAEVLAECIRFSGEVMVTQALAEELSAAGLKDLVAHFSAVQEIVLVGHEPFLGLLTRELLSIPEPCVLKKGSVVTLQVGFHHASTDVEFVRLVTGGANEVAKRDKALDRLVGRKKKAEEAGVL